MKAVPWIIAVAAIASVLPAHAQDRAPFKPPPRAFGPAVVGGAFSQIYVISGVRDNAAAINTGVATSFHCTNLSGVSESLAFVVQAFDGAVVTSTTFTVPSNHTWTASTHGTVLFNEDAFLSEGADIDQGIALIYSTTLYMFCSAMIVDASVANPVGISLHMVRVNPIAGTTE
jgi:hypothetical protein